MKALVFACTDGNFKLLHEVFAREEDNAHVSICVGDLPIVSDKTPLYGFWKKSFTSEGRAAKKFLKDNPSLDRLVYAVPGGHDDIFAKPGENVWKNVLPVNHYSIIDMGTYAEQPMQGFMIPVTKTVKVGFLGGYYNQESWNKINADRIAGKRQRSSLALCEEDFTQFDKQLLTFLFTYEAPTAYDFQKTNFHCGFSKIDTLVSQTQPTLHFHSHLREYNHGYIYESLSIGVPPLKDGYLIVDLFYNTVCVKDANGETVETLKNEKK